MLLHRPVARIALAALFVIATFGVARSQNPTANTATATLEKRCQEWGADLKRVAAGASNDAQRDAGIKAANQNLQTTLLVTDIPAGDFTALTAKLRTCLEREGKAAFGTGTTVVVSLNPTNQKKQPIPTSSISGTIQVSPGAPVKSSSAPATSTSSTSDVLAANKSLGRQWGDKCLSQGSMSCCKASADHDCKTADLCKLAVKMCETMVTCNKTLNDCKKRTMDDPKNKDPRCDGAACKQCTADYKKCHDAAVQISN